MTSQKDEFVLDGLPTLRGVLADLANNFMDNAYRPHRISAYLSALVFGSVICSRNYCFEGSYANTYNVIFGSSGSGKADLEKILNRWSYDVYCPDIIMSGSSFTSDSGVHSALAAQPQSLICIDEFGLILGNMSNDVIGKTALVTLTKAYTLNGQYMRPKKYSKKVTNKKGPEEEVDDREKVINRPALVLVGFGTPEQMNLILAEENFESGEMSRYMFWYIPDEIVHYSLSDTHLPDRAVSRILDVFQIGGNIINEMDGMQNVNISAYNDPLPIPVPCILEDGEYDLKQLDVLQQKKVIECKDVVEKTLATRMLDKGKRIAITLALLNQPYKSMQSKIDIIKNGVSVTQKAFTDGIEIAGKSNKVMKKYEKERKIYPARIVKACTRIDELIHMCGKGWTTREEIALNNIKMSPNDWKLVEEYLEDIGIGWHESVLPGQRGRSVKIYGTETPNHMEAVKYDLDES